MMNSLELLMLTVFIVGVCVGSLAVMYCNESVHYECKKLREENDTLYKAMYDIALQSSWKVKLRFLLQHGFLVSFLNNGSAWCIISEISDQETTPRMLLQCNDPYSEDDGTSMVLEEALENYVLDRSHLKKELRRLMTSAVKNL